MTKRQRSSMLRPQVRIPLWAAAVIPVAAYVVRSSMRGWDFSPDLPVDALLGGLLVAVIALALWLRNTTAPDDAEHQLSSQVEREDDAEGGDR